MRVYNKDYLDNIKNVTRIAFNKLRLMFMKILNEMYLKMKINKCDKIGSSVGRS